MNYLANVSTLALDTQKCTGCGVCSSVCPRAVFVVENRKAWIVDRDACMECGACKRNCAFDAITVNSGVGCAEALIRAMLTGGEPTCGCGGEGSSSGCC